ncbi:hypothetical protein KDA_69530 [Dictyobacter alpinus]|uniref:Elongation factor G-binding protein n=1 Tax=Dictyobacter alpinus TaxID=2014873 RepID=A0A402BJE4_9CHLR|nr:FusB/FusC family EF-G-binding protein [Dictyobacter alpinus]GCE31469.1 hypothetical protein KDA_69530 [Dictyobacter alpinus]
MDIFLQNHQYNYIMRQGRLIMSTIRTCTDNQVIETFKYSAVSKVLDACPGLSEEHQQLLKRLGDLQTAEELQLYLDKILQCTFKFPAITETRLQRLFPKVKKLSMPDLTEIDERPLTYFTWMDTATNKHYLVYYRQPQPSKEAAGKLVGIQGQYTSTNKTGICAFCKKTGDASLFSVRAKTRSAQSPDYYRSVGQYICLDSKVCNTQITELDALESFIESVSR